MELIPFIYTALVVVAALTVITITVSFISFKKKQNHRQERKITPSITQSITGQNELIQQHQAGKNVSKSTTETHEKSKATHANKKIQINPQHEVKNKEIKNSKKEPNINNERIQVIKELSNKKGKNPPFLPGRSSKKDQQKNIPGRNDLDHYHDDGDDNFYAPKVPDK